MFTLVFGSLDQALATSRRFHQRHSSIKGVLPEAIGSYPAGSPYREEFASSQSARVMHPLKSVETALSFLTEHAFYERFASLRECEDLIALAPSTRRTRRLFPPEIIPKKRGRSLKHSGYQ
jgi:hypothetical protein